MNVLLQAFFMFLFFAINNEDFDCREKWEIIKNGNLSTAMLGHLSKESNFPELAYRTVIDEIISSHFEKDSLKLSVANRDYPSKLIQI